MNDWLDYQGSGSSRAYLGHSLDSVADKLTPKSEKQYLADKRLVDAYAVKAKKLKSEYKSLESNYNKYVELYNYNKDVAESQESKRAELAKSGHTLKATQFFEKNVHRYKKDASDAKSEADSCLAQMKANIDAQKKLQADVNDIDTSAYKYNLILADIMDGLKANRDFIPDELPSNVSQRIKQSYFDMPADDFIEHAAKGRVRFRDSINDTIGKVMDKVTDADHKASDARSKQREADERLEKAQVERTAKEIRDAADKLYGDAADVRKEASDYRAKLDNTWTSLVNRQDRAKDPRALAQIDSARRNISNDILRTYDQLSSKIIELYRERDKIQNWYNNFVYSYPSGYVTTVPRLLQDSKKYLDEASESSHSIILNREKRIWN